MLVHCFLWQFSDPWQVSTWFSLDLTCDRSVHDFHAQFSDLWQVSAWFSRTIHCLAIGRCMVFPDNFSYIRQVSALLSLPIQWFATGRCMVFSDSSVTCDRSVLSFHWQFSDLRQVSAWVSLTIQWLATGQYMVFSGQFGDLHKSNWPPQYKWNIVTIRWKTKNTTTSEKFKNLNGKL